MVRTLPLETETRLDPSRILAIAAAIAVHAFAFLLLLVPLATSSPAYFPVDPKPIINWVEVKIDPPIVPTVVPITPTHPTRLQTPTVVQQQTVLPAVDPVIVDNGTIAADPVAQTSTSMGEPGPSIGTPLTGVQLEYAYAPAPTYPRDAARAGLEGQVVLKVLVGTDGKPLDVQISASSGHRLLDDTAKRFVMKNWRFKPAMRDGQAVQAYGMVPISFSMQ